MASSGILIFLGGEVIFKAIFGFLIKKEVAALADVIFPIPPKNKSNLQVDTFYVACVLVN